MLTICLGLAMGQAATSAQEKVEKQPIAKAAKPFWRTDYADAARDAKAGKKLLAVHFTTDGKPPAGADLLAKRPELLGLRVRPDYTMPDADTKKPFTLRDHAAFQDLSSREGLALIDFRHPGPNHETVVSVLPAEYLGDERLVSALVDLPEGTLTQRTLIWAFRVHGEAPQSTTGPTHPDLMAHAERHSAHQAATSNQHHNMPSFANGEIVAESWPWNKCVVAAAIDIVGSWRQSPGHWGQAVKAHGYYGYDMKTNGNKWYATGVFIQ